MYLLPYQEFHGNATLLGGCGDVTAAVDREILKSPPVDVVKFGAVFDAPFVNACQFFF